MSFELAPGTIEGQLSNPPGFIWMMGTWIPYKDNGDNAISLQAAQGGIVTVETLATANALLSIGGASTFVSEDGNFITKTVNNSSYTVEYTSTAAIIREGVNNKTGIIYFQRDYVAST